MHKRQRETSSSAADAGDDTSHAPGFRVLVRGLPAGVTEVDLKRALSNNGTISEIRLLQHDGDGNPQLAVVQYSDKSAAVRALHMSESVQLKGQPLAITAPKGGIAYDTTSAKTMLHKQHAHWVGVVVDRIPKQVSEMDIKAAARVHGAVAQVELKRGGTCAHIDFVTLLGAQNAVEGGVTIKDKKLTARYRSEQQAADTPLPLITLHLANLHPKTTVEDIKEALQICGHIRDVRLAKKSSGFVDVETKTASRKACRMSPVTIKGSKVTITLASKQSHLQRISKQEHAAAAGGGGGGGGGGAAIDPEHRSTTTVFIKNLPYEFVEEDVRKIFRKCGRVKGMRLFKDHDTGEFKGMAYVDLEGAEQVEEAVKLSGTDIKGRKIVVDYTLGKKEALEAIGKTYTEPTPARQKKRQRS